MKVAVTGGTGFLGAPLVRRLVDAGHQVTVLTRKPAALSGLPSGVSAARFDAFEPAPDTLLQGFDAVIHLAGESIAERWTPEQKERVVKSRKIGTEAIARAAVASGTVRALVSTSAIGYYGPHGDEPLDETSAPGSDFLAQVCQVWEAATAPAQEAGLRTAIIRIGIVLHPDGGALKRMTVPFKLGAGGRFGDGNQYMSWIHRDDLLRLFVHVLEQPTVSGVLNGTAPNPVTNRDFVRELGRALHRPALVPAPKFALKLALGEMSTMVLDGQKVLPRRTLDSGFTFEYPTLEAALRQLFWAQAA